MFGSKRKDQKWLEITVYQKKYTIKHFILYILALKGPNYSVILTSAQNFCLPFYQLDSTQPVECVELSTHLTRCVESSYALRPISLLNRPGNMKVS